MNRLRQQQRAQKISLARYFHSDAIPCWHKWLVILAVLSTVVLYSIAATHHHKTLAQELGCAACHVAGHNSLDVFKPNVRPLMSPVSRRLPVPMLANMGVIPATFPLKPPSRAPPAFAQFRV
jgi:hypothetical protein